MRSESESEDQCSQELLKSDEDTRIFHKKSKVLYTRMVLVSFSELDVCKRLPSGLEESSLGELSICSTGLLHSCHDSDSSMFHGNLPPHLLPNRDCGLLGSGASPKVFSCVSGASDPVVKGSSYHLLNRSIGSYWPPHLCKAKVQSSAENEDFYNSETFGPTEHLSQERAEEESKRRDSFELMRKERCRVFHEKENKICDEHKENLDPEIGMLMEASGTCKRLIKKYNESEECAISQAEASDPAEHAFTAQTSASTFLLPSVLKSRSITKSLTGIFISEPCDTRGDHIKGYGLRFSGLDDQHLEEKKPAGGISSGYMKAGFEVNAPLNEEITKKNSINLPSRRNEIVMASTTTSTIEISEKLHNWNKQNVTPLVLPHEYFKLSVLPDLNEHYSTNLHSVKGWGTNHMNGMHPTSAAGHGACQYLSLGKNSLHQTDAYASSMLNRESLDKLCFSAIEGSPVDLQTTESSGIQRDSAGMLPRNDVLKYHRFPFPCGHKNYIFPSNVNESGSIKINCEGIMSSSCTKQTVASKIEENLLISDDTQAKIVNLRSEPEGKLSPVSGFYEDVDSINGLCLPDEDSLITVDDRILPLESTSISAGRLFKANLLTTSTQVDVADKQATLNPFLGEKRSTQLGLEGPVFDSYDMTGSVTSYANLHTQQYFPQFGHYQGSQGRVNFTSSEAQQVQMRSLYSETNIYAPQPLQPFPSNVLADHFQHPHPDLRRFGHPTNSPLPQQMPVPNNFPHHQVHGFPRGSPSPRSTSGNTSYGQELYPLHYFPYDYQRQNYGGFRMPNPGHTVGVIGNQAAVGKSSQMEVRSRQTHPLAMAGHGSGSFGNQVDTGLWYGQ